MNLKRAVAYLRVSSEDQVTNFSLENQKDFCQKFCREHDYELVKVFVDAGRSASTLEGRQGLLELLSYCQTHKGNVDACLAYRLDRISRNTLDFLTVQHQLSLSGVKILSASEPLQGDDPTTEFLTTLLAAIAKMDNQIRRLRAVQGLQKRLEAGLNVTQPPMGYKMVKDSNNRSIPIPKEPEFSLLKKAGLLYATGKYSCVQIAEMLNDWGVKTMYGHKIKSNAVGKFIRCEFYKGTVHLKRTGRRYKGSFEPMFSEQEWQALQDAASGRPLGAKKRNLANDFPLRQFVRCSITGELFTGSQCRGKRKKYPYYYTSTRHKSLRRETLENAFVGLLNSLEPTQGVVESFAQIMFEKYGEEYKNLEAAEKHFKGNLTAQNMFRVGLVESRLKGETEPDEFVKEYEQVENHIIVTELARNEVLIDEVTIATVNNFAKHYLNHLGQYWRTHEIAEKKAIQWLIFPEGLTWNYPGWRTPKLSQLFKVKESITNVNILVGEGGGNRTLDERLKRPSLYH